jgi:small subunit ribosomal protein S16
MKHDPVYHVVVADKSKARDGKFIEKLGVYFPKRTNPSEKIQMDKARAEFWLKRGATPSNTVKSLLKSAQ